ncbi:PD40 domain-containing protein [Nafulsella turpanensis]|uniref:PD40 domain-containing protein n=1 Tax=Nafulsella turpanensis TaxID=1265690 RepID=UPI000348064E|nr:PD40 domain-containing protein [Nafulsella turpanensis]
MPSSLKTLLLALCLAIPLLAPAQITKNDFGKNRLQYKVFNWRYYSTNNFDIYFYDDGQQLARLTADFMEDEYDRITDLLGYAPYSKTKIFLYNSIADLQQSNIGVNENSFTVGGQTNFVKSHVEVAFPGTLEEFKEELVYEVSNMLIMDMMFGGSLTDIFQSTYLMTLPEWFINGAARYVAYGWNVEMDDFMRDLLQDGKIPKLKKLDGEEAALVGQSIWNYIAEKYGRSNISSVLNYTRIIRNEETAIANTLGIPFKFFLADWKKYYLDMVEATKEGYRQPAADAMVTESGNEKGIYNSLALSPDGRYLAYAENYRGRYRIKLKDIETGNEKTVLRKGYRVIDQEIDDTVPLVSWQDNGTLGVVGVEKGLYTLYLYNLETENTSSQVIGKISQVNDFSFSPNGKVVVMSAEKEGQNDIYLYSISRNTLRAITSDLYDDVFPTFMPGTNDIIFSSNRTTDTLNTRGISMKEISDNYNLFIFNVDTTRQVLTRVTNTISKDIKPIADSLGNIYFLSDQKGIYNLFRYNLHDSLYNQITSYNTSIRDYDLDTDKNLLAFISLYEGNEEIFLEKGIDLNTNNFTMPTQRQTTRQARYVFRKREEKAPVPVKAPDTLAEKELPVLDLPDSLPPDSLIAVDTLTADTLLADTLVADTPSLVEEEDTRLIDTDNYVFEEEVEEELEVEEEVVQPAQKSFLSTYRKLRRENPVRGPFPLEPRFMLSSLVTSWTIDPLRSSIGGSGVGFILEGQMSDMLENHKIYGGVLAMTDLRSGDLFLEYEFLKYLLDFNARFGRRVIFQPLGNYEKHKYVLNELSFGASLPLNVSTRIAAGPVFATSRFLEVTYNSLVNPTAGAPGSAQTFYAGGHVELVYDNTLLKGFNLYNGTMGRLEYQHLLGIGQAEMGFGKLSAELKNYFPISREFILATRGFFGNFVGHTPPKFIMGGMDNWILNKTDSPEGDVLLEAAEGRDNRNLLFHEFVTPMRGFNYNALNGRSALVFNAELRFPLIRYFYRGPISSNFFRNLLAVGFYDIGSAWTGQPPFFRNNSVNTVVKDDGEGPFRAVIQNYKNPWLTSFGFGVRTVLLGYYLKFDVAYPMIDYQVEDPKFYLTFGYDF